MGQPRAITVVAGSAAARAALVQGLVQGLQTVASTSQSPVELTILLDDDPSAGRTATSPAAAIILVVPAAGVDEGCRQAWSKASSTGRPVLLAVSDDGAAQRLDYLGTVDAAREAFGAPVRAVGVPVVGATAQRAGGVDDGEPTGVVDLLSWTLFDESSGVLTLAPASDLLVQALLPERKALLDQIVDAAGDQLLRARLTAGHRVAQPQLIKALRTAVSTGGLVPAVPVNPVSGLGILPLLELLVLAQADAPAFG